MSPQRWRKLEALYDAAVELTPEERARFLDQECGDDDDMRRQLTAMLRDNGGFTGVVQSAAAAVVDDAGKWIGERLGPYRIVRLIGHGGMGAVYEGIREDAFQKRVAIKLVKVSFDRSSDPDAREPRMAFASSRSRVSAAGCFAIRYQAQHSATAVVSVPAPRKVMRLSRSR